ncbi:23S rRNA (adenine(1618)-N(6))-methyltransferase RlmF [Runella sp.]|uniref:23S rRNA (adenine(1618)-N(6))-methyltransferase RlmF n=1 Tax=Runella sp. TaxID=1960881 RepID=UPI003D12696B
MSSEIESASSEKQGLHPRNPHRFRYDFKALIKSCPALAPFVSLNKYHDESIDFANPEAVKMLNKAILIHFYGIHYWDIPANYLRPPIPGRADYIHYIADLLSAGNDADIPMGKAITGLDIGVGANCVYPIIGHQSYGWSFVGSDIDPKALQSAKRIITSNPALTPFVECRLQSSPSSIFKGIVQPNERFDFTMCNPPFHSSQEEASAGTQRKWQNLGRTNLAKKDTLNFGGQNAELWCEGGEKAFITRMIEQSAQLANRCFWFTTLVSKKTTLPFIYKSLKTVKAFDTQTIEMAQGQKVSRIVAWTFLGNHQQKVWRQERFS